MKRLPFTIFSSLLCIIVCGQVFGQNGEVADKKTDSVQADVLIETFFNP